MIQSEAMGRTLSAIVVSDLDEVKLHLTVGDGSGIWTVEDVGNPPGAPISYYRSAAADVAIADDPGAPGFRYHVAVTFREYLFAPNYDYNLLAQEFEVDISTGSPVVTFIGIPQTIAFNVPGNPTLRIDAVLDAGSIGGGGMPLVNEFLILYTDAAGGNLVAHKDINLNNVGGVFPQTLTIPSVPGFFATDIAATIDYSGGSPDLIACISGLDGFSWTGGTDLYAFQFKVATGTTSLPTWLKNASGAGTGWLYNPRIEAFGIYGPEFFFKCPMGNSGG